VCWQAQRPPTPPPPATALAGQNTALAGCTCTIAGEYLKITAGPPASGECVECYTITGTAAVTSVTATTWPDVAKVTTAPITVALAASPCTSVNYDISFTWRFTTTEINRQPQSQSKEDYATITVLSGASPVDTFTVELSNYPETGDSGEETYTATRTLAPGASEVITVEAIVGNAGDGQYHPTIAVGAVTITKV